MPGAFDHVDEHSDNCDRRCKANLRASEFLETFLVDRSTRWIDSVRYARQPWFVHVSFVSPHVPTVSPKGQWDSAYDGRPLPTGTRVAGLAHAVQSVPAQARWMNGLGMSSGTATAPMSHAQRLSYYVQAAYVDAQLGRLLDYLERRDLAKGTFFLYTSDHGCMLGEHHIDQKHAFYDGAMRVPLILRWPGVLAPGTQATFASTVDIPATIATAAGRARLPPSYSGFDLVGPLATNGASPRSAAAAVLYTACVLITPHWKLAYYPEEDETRLWDRRGDPEELRDVWADDSGATALPGVAASSGVARSEEVRPRADGARLMATLLRWRSLQIPLSLLRSHTQTAGLHGGPVAQRVATHTRGLRMSAIELDMQRQALRVAACATCPAGVSAPSDPGSSQGLGNSTPSDARHTVASDVEKVQTAQKAAAVSFGEARALLRLRKRRGGDSDHSKSPQARGQVRAMREKLLPLVAAAPSLNNRTDSAPTIVGVMITAFRKPPLTLAKLQAKIEARNGAAWVEAQVKKIVALSPKMATPKKGRRSRASGEHTEEEDDDCSVAAQSKAVVLIGEQKSGTTLLATLLKSAIVLGQDSPTPMDGQGRRPYVATQQSGLTSERPNTTRHSYRPLVQGLGRRLGARPSAAALGDQDPQKKELHLFDHPSENCVRQPSACVARLCSRQESAERPGGWLVDATPSYFSSAAALAQLAAALPRAKLLLLLREPVGRAMSAWKQNLKAESEPRTFDAAVLDELEALASRCYPADARLLVPIRRSLRLTASAPPAGQLGAPPPPMSSEDEGALRLVTRISSKLVPWEGGSKSSGQWQHELRDLVPKRKGDGLSQFVARVVGSRETSCRLSSPSCWMAKPYTGKQPYT